jgi:hypothetical protein
MRSNALKKTSGVLYGALLLALMMVIAPSTRAMAGDSEPAAALKPLFSVAVISDNHFWAEDLNDEAAIWQRGGNPRLLAALKYINEVIKPDFVIFNGDCILGMGAYNPPLDLEVKMMLLFDRLVDENLDTPFLQVYGNHDGYAYAKLFGNGNFLINHKGVGFMFLGIEFAPDFSGAGFFTQWDWLAKTLKAENGRPVIAFIHTPMYAPTFNNALNLKSKLEKAGNVIGVLGGHNHQELLLYSAGMPHLTLPQVIREPGYTFVRLDFFPDKVVVRAVEKESEEATYNQDRIILEIPIPEKLRPLDPNVSDPVVQPSLPRE